MKINKKGYMLVEIIVSFVLAFSIAMYLLNLTIKFKDTNEEIYYSANYTKDRNLIVRNIMDDLEKGTVTYVGKDVSNSNYVNFTLDIDGIKEYRKLKIDIVANTYSIEYGKTNNTYTTFETSHSSYYKKSLNSGLIISDPKIEIANNVFSLTIPVESMYSDETYDIKLIAPCYAVSYMKSFSDRTIQEAFRVNYLDGIRTVSFVNNMNDAGAVSSGDFSDERNEGEVKYWITGTPGSYNLYIGSDNVIVADSLAYLFAGMTNLKEIDFGNLQTVVTKDMKEMFYDCRSLTSLDLQSFDTSSVTNMSSMFQGASSLTGLNLKSFNTSNVSTMEAMFYECSSLKNENFEGLNNFDTSNVRSMQAMFFKCKSLTSLDLSNFDTSNVTTMTCMFQFCINLGSLKLNNNFNTINVEHMNFMFGNCENLTNLELGDKFDTRNVTTMEAMFQNLYKLVELDVSNFTTTKVTDFTEMFNGMTLIQTLKLGSDFFNTNESIITKDMFNGCPALSTDITIKSNIISDYNNMFYGSATESGASIKVNYTSDTSSLVDDMINTKSATSNVIKGELVS